MMCISQTTFHIKVLWLHVKLVSYWKHGKNETICLLLSGCVCRLRVHLRRGATYVFASQDSRLPGQYLLGSHHCWTSFVHPSFLSIPACETTHVQLGKINKNIQRVVTLQMRWTQLTPQLLMPSLFWQAGAIVTVLMLLIFYTSSIFLFVGTCLCGLFLSSIFPCMLAYTEDILDYQGIVKQWWNNMNDLVI